MVRIVALILGCMKSVINMKSEQEEDRWRIRKRVRNDEEDKQEDDGEEVKEPESKPSSIDIICKI
jgi:hypothetical protein